MQCHFYLCFAIGLVFCHRKLAYAPYAALLSLTHRTSLHGWEHHTSRREEASRMLFQKPGSNETRKTLTLKA